MKLSKLFVIFVIIGAIATLIDMTFLFLLTEFFNVWYFYSAAIAFSIGAVVNYSLNKYVNFKNKSKKIAKQFSLFLIIALVGLLLNQILIYGLVEFVSLWYIYAKVISAFIILFWTYNANKHLTFKLFR